MRVWVCDCRVVVSAVRLAELFVMICTCLGFYFYSFSVRLGALLLISLSVKWSFVHKVRFHDGEEKVCFSGVRGTQVQRKKKGSLRGLEA